MEPDRGTQKEWGMGYGEGMLRSREAQWRVYIPRVALARHMPRPHAQSAGRAMVVGYSGVLCAAVRYKSLLSDNH